MAKPKLKRAKGIAAVSEDSGGRAEILCTLACAVFGGATYALSLLGDGAPGWARKMTALQYAEGGGLYRAGPDDAYVVVFMAALLTVLRKVFMVGLFTPIARALRVHEAVDSKPATDKKHDPLLGYTHPHITSRPHAYTQPIVPRACASAPASCTHRS